jgi:hypothetical protein
LSAGCIRILEDTLAKGCIRLLARGGGWRRERHLRINQIVDGRLWERTPPGELGLHFSRHTLELLMWFTAENASDPNCRRSKPPSDSLTAADALVCYHVYTVLRQTPVACDLTKQLGFGTQALCWLAFPEDFTRRAAAEKPDLTAWAADDRAWILEALQGQLTRRWVDVERGKSQVQDWMAMQALGSAQERILDAFFQAAERAGRYDLARFLLAAIASLLPESASVADWTGGMKDTGKRFADREVTLQKALAVVRQLERLRQWQQAARNVGYFEETYAAAQMWKSEWERWDGEELVKRAEAVMRPLNINVRHSAR